MRLVFAMVITIGVLAPSRALAQSPAAPPQRDVRDELSKIDTEGTGILARAAEFEKMSDKMPREEREGIQRMIESFKAQATILEKRRQDLGNEESLLLQQVSADQGRWNDVNAQLDDIERTLATPPKK